MGQINFFTLFQEQKNNKCRNNLYYISQLEFAYNSSKMAGMALSDSDVRLMYDENILISDGKAFNLNDVFEVYNHFQIFDYVLDNVNTPLSEDFIREIYKRLKKNTKEELDFPNTFGEYRKQNLEHVNYDISSPKNIQSDMYKLISEYESQNEKMLEDIIEFHFNFESIHPYNDANGRIGRMIMFKECIRNNIVPFIVLDESKLDYYRGLKAYKEDKSIMKNYFCKLQQIYENVAKKFDNVYEL